jgi:hypothetical protein
MEDRPEKAKILPQGRIRIPFLPLFHARIGCFLSFDWWGQMLQSSI